MRKSIKRFVALTLGISMLALNVQPIFAGSEDNLPLYSETKEKLTKVVNSHPEYEGYLNGVIDSIKESDFATNEAKVNNFVIEAITQTQIMGKKADEDYQQAIQEYENRTSSRGVITYATALALYNQGISLVEQRGCPHTADYMRHAIRPEDSSGWPQPIEDYNTNWAYELVYDCYEFQGVITDRFESEILPYNTSGGTISGSFAYTKSNSSLDAFASLHNVDYIVTFTKRAGGGYNTKFSLHDVYDFQWSNQYSDFAVGFGNNYCALMQQMNWIRPYDIFVTVV